MGPANKLVKQVKKTEVGVSDQEACLRHYWL